MGDANEDDGLRSSMTGTDGECLCLDKEGLGDTRSSGLSIIEPEDKGDAKAAESRFDGSVVGAAGE